MVTAVDTTSVRNSQATVYVSISWNSCSLIGVSTSLNASLIHVSIFFIEQYDNEQYVCSFTESIRYEAFDSYGRYAEAYSSSRAGTRRVTKLQIALLVLTCVSSVVLSIYSCYVHHKITNLLLKQLSARGKLLPHSPRSRGYFSKPISSVSSVSEESTYMA